jgi:CheY-like chemotaxis protein
LEKPLSATALIVEDEIFVALDLERILTEAGYHVAAIAADRDGALEAAKGCQFALVDVNLRDGPTGPDLAATLVREFGLRVIFVTANPTQIEGARGALGFVRKPFSQAAILAAAALANAPPSPANDDLLQIDGGVSLG